MIKRPCQIATKMRWKYIWNKKKKKRGHMLTATTGLTTRITSHGFGMFPRSFLAFATRVFASCCATLMATWFPACSRVLGCCCGFEVELSTTAAAATGTAYVDGASANCTTHRVRPRDHQIWMRSHYFFIPIQQSYPSWLCRCWNSSLDVVIILYRQQQQPVLYK